MIRDPARAALTRLLEAAVRIGGATRGTIQLVNEQMGWLEIVVHYGFDRTLLDDFHQVVRHDASACARAWHHGRRVIVADLATDPYFGLYDRVSSGRFRAAQATPLVSGDRVIGVLSTYFPEPVRLSRGGVRALDRIAREIADALDQGGWRARA